jgi:hypothetical protein
MYTYINTCNLCSFSPRPTFGIIFTAVGAEVKGPTCYFHPPRANPFMIIIPTFFVKERLREGGACMFVHIASLGAREIMDRKRNQSSSGNISSNNLIDFHDPIVRFIDEDRIL